MNLFAFSPSFCVFIKKARAEMNVSHTALPLHAPQSACLLTCGWCSHRRLQSLQQRREALWYAHRMPPSPPSAQALLFRLQLGAAVCSIWFSVSLSTSGATEQTPTTGEERDYNRKRDQGNWADLCGHWAGLEVLSAPLWEENQTGPQPTANITNALSPRIYLWLIPASYALDELKSRSSENN